MHHRQKFVVLGLLLLLSLFLNIALGSVIIPIHTWKDWFAGQELDQGFSQIILYRWHKALTTILTGAALSLSGLFMQSIFRNPIVGPYVLGTSAAAGLGVAVLLLGGAIAGVQLPDISIAVAAVIGSAMSLLLIIGLYQKLKSAVNLLIAGLMTGIFTGAVINILSYFTQADALQKYVFWSMGNLGNLPEEQLQIMLLIIPIIIFMSIFFIKKLNALLLGENYAKSMGVNVHYTHISLLILTGILVGIVTAFVGPVGFIGLAVPHIARMYFKTHLHQILIPAVVLVGAILLLICDTIAQLPGSSMSLPINSITALFGAPLTLYLILKRK